MLKAAAATLTMATLLFSIGAAHAAPEAPKATAMLFDAPHLSNVGKGEQLNYDFDRKVSDPKLLGPSYDDKISVDVTDAESDGKRNVVVKVFTGQRARTPQKIAGMTGNPLLVVFLDHAVANMAQLSGGKRPYLKQKIKMSFVNGAKVEPVKIAYNGGTVDGNRIKIAPFVGDPNALKMMGYDGASFEIVVSDHVPGEFASLSAHYESPMKGSPSLDEVTKLEGVGDIK